MGSFTIINKCKWIWGHSQLATYTQLSTYTSGYGVIHNYQHMQVNIRSFTIINICKWMWGHSLLPISQRIKNRDGTKTYVCSDNWRNADKSQPYKTPNLITLKSANIRKVANHILNGNYKLFMHILLKRKFAKNILQQKLKIQFLQIN